MTKLFIILALVAIGASVGHGAASTAAVATNKTGTFGPQPENKTKAAPKPAGLGEKPAGLGECGKLSGSWEANKMVEAPNDNSKERTRCYFLDKECTWGKPNEEHCERILKQVQKIPDDTSNVSASCTNGCFTTFYHATATEATKTAKPASCNKLDAAKDAKKICAAVGDKLDVLTGCKQTTKATCVGGCVWSAQKACLANPDSKSKAKGCGTESTTNGRCSPAKDLTAVKEHKGKFTSCNVNAGDLWMQGLVKKCKDFKAKTECSKGCRWEISHYDKRERNDSSRGIATEHVCKVDVLHAFKNDAACGVNDKKKAIKYMKAMDKFKADDAKKVLAQKNKELATLKKFKSQNCGANKTAAFDTSCNSNAQDLNATEADVAAMGAAVEGYELLAKSSAAIPDPTSEPTATTKPGGVPAGAAAHAASLIMALFVAAAAALAM
jgi:hypothetical protein